MIINNTSVDQQEIAKFAQYANDWWDTQGPLRTLHDINETRLRFIAQHIKLKDSRILDVGCGGGILCEAMSKAGAKIVGVDAEVQAIKVATEHAKKNNLSIEYYCTALEEYEAEPVDAVTCMELLEHVPYPELIIQHCTRLLKPGGTLILSTLNRTLKAYATAIVAAEYLLNLLPRQTHDYEKFINPSELASMGRKWDLKVIGLSGLIYNPLNRNASLGPDVSVNYLMAVGRGP
jgi:2-polyprenyl-6-hydroxyphenyl methylase/3-demethylubiquinone-9 3-methyltransferase